MPPPRHPTSGSAWLLPSQSRPEDATLESWGTMLLAAGMFALRRLSPRVGTCTHGNAVRPLAEASLPLPPERRYSDGNARLTLGSAASVFASRQEPPRSGSPSASGRNPARNPVRNLSGSVAHRLATEPSSGITSAITITVAGVAGQVRLSVRVGRIIIVPERWRLAAVLGRLRRPGSPLCSWFVSDGATASARADRDIQC